MFDDTRTRIAERQRTGIEVLDFNRRDTKGRTIGAIIARGKATFVPVTPDSVCGFYRKPAGTYFWFSPHATRAGAIFGPTQPYPYFDTEAEREDAVAKYIKGARKRAER